MDILTHTQAKCVPGAFPSRNGLGTRLGAFCILLNVSANDLSFTQIMALQKMFSLYYISHSVGHVEESISLSEISEFSSIFLAPSPTPTLTEQNMMEMDQLSEQETRDLLISVLFVLKYLDRGSCVIKKCFSPTRIRDVCSLC